VKSNGNDRPHHDYLSHIRLLLCKFLENPADKIIGGRGRRANLLLPRRAAATDAQRPALKGRSLPLTRTLYCGGVLGFDGLFGSDGLFGFVELFLFLW
jgi:hypothetical protein